MVWRQVITWTNGDLVHWRIYAAPGLNQFLHYSDVIMIVMAFQITGVSIVYSTVCSGEDQRKHQSSASLALVRGIPRWPVNFPHKGPVTRKMFPFHDVIMSYLSLGPNRQLSLPRPVLSLPVITCCDHLLVCIETGTRWLTFSNVFCGMKMLYFCCWVHWSLFFVCRIDNKSALV